MEDISLDEYIQQKHISLSIGRNKAPLVRNNGKKVIKALKRQNTVLASSNDQIQAKKPFDARQRLNLTTDVPQKQDARVNIVSKKTFVQDARQKIAQKAIMIQPQDNISQIVDARAKLNNMQFMPKKEESGSNFPHQNIQMTFGIGMNAKADLSSKHSNKEVTLKNLGRSLVKTVTNDAASFPQKNIFYAAKTSATESQPSSSVTGRKVSNLVTTSTLKTMENPKPEEKTFISPLQSFRVIVNNLGPNVTYDDIEELFTSCGPLRKLKMTKPGAAEVFYVNIESAYEAVEEYHNRELDDKPMSVALAFLQDKDKLNETKPLRSKKQMTVMKQSLEIDPSVINQAVFRASSCASVVDFTVHL